MKIFEDILEKLIPFLESKKNYSHIVTFWVYRNKCLVVEFNYKGVEFKFDLTPDSTGKFSVDVFNKRSVKNIAILTDNANKLHISSNVKLEAAFEDLNNSLEKIKGKIEKSGSPILNSTLGVVKTVRPIKEHQRDSLKIGLMTLPLNKNFGGNLQIFALMEKLKQMGHQPVIINRKHPPQDFKENTTLLSRDAKKPIMAKNYGMSEKLQNASFVNTHLVPATRKFHSSAQLSENIDKYNFDAVVVGSDQVWRAKYARTISKDFFFDFLSNHASPPKRISYAASFGADKMGFDSVTTDEIRKLIQKFDATLVREDGAVSLCEKQLGSQSAHHVLDPTMLLKPTDYEALFKHKNFGYNGDRLLAYVLDTDEEKNEVINAIEKRLNLKAYSTNGMPLTAVSVLKNNEGDRSVESWVASFHSAKFVVTDSFHGTAFSILFNRPFIAYGNPKRGMARFTSLLKMFGLEDRLVVNASDANIDKLLEPINWDKVNSRLSELQSHSIKLLTDALHIETKPEGADSTKTDEMVRLGFSSNNSAWQITPSQALTTLNVLPNMAIRGNLIWCDLPQLLQIKQVYRLTINWSVQTEKPGVNLCIRNSETGRVHIIGVASTKGRVNSAHYDIVEFMVPRNGFSQFALGAASFTGEGASANISSITIQKVENTFETTELTPYAKQAKALALLDSERLAAANDISESLGGSRARMMFSAHSIEKGLSRTNFRAGFGRNAIMKLSKEMNNWVSASHDVTDEFFLASASAMHSYFEHHKKLDVNVSNFRSMFNTVVQEFIDKGNDGEGGVLSANLVREPIPTTNSDNRFLDVVYGRRSIREWSEKVVSDTLIHQAVQIASQAPSVCNRQAVRVHQFKDPKIIEELVNLQGGFNGYKKPPSLLLVSSDLTAFISAKERNQAYIDGGLFMMAFLLGLEQVGLGTCSLNLAMATRKEREMRAILNIPDTEVCIAFVAAGYYDSSVLVPRSKRYSVDHIFSSHEVNNSK